MKQQSAQRVADPHIRKRGWYIHAECYPFALPDDHRYRVLRDGTIRWEFHPVAEGGKALDWALAAGHPECCPICDEPFRTGQAGMFCALWNFSPDYVEQMRQEGIL